MATISSLPYEVTQAILTHLPPGAVFSFYLSHHGAEATCTEEFFRLKYSLDFPTTLVPAGKSRKEAYLSIASHLPLIRALFEAFTEPLTLDRLYEASNSPLSREYIVPPFNSTDPIHWYRRNLSDPSSFELLLERRARVQLNISEDRGNRSICPFVQRPGLINVANGRMVPLANFEPRVKEYNAVGYVLVRSRCKSDTITLGSRTISIIESLEYLERRGLVALW